MGLRITDLAYTRQRGRGLATVTFDDGTTLSLDAELAVRFQLKRGLAMTDAELDALRAAQARLEARQRLIRYLALRRKTRRECVQYLERLRFPPDAIDEAVAAADTLGMIDDTRYAEAFARTRGKGARLGPRAIRHELMARGVDAETAYAAIAPAQDPDAQRANARRAAERKADSLRKSADPAARTKLMQFLMRKGYDTDVAREVSRELLGQRAASDHDE